MSFNEPGDDTDRVTNLFQIIVMSAIFSCLSVLALAQMGFGWGVALVAGFMSGAALTLMAAAALYAVAERRVRAKTFQAPVTAQADSLDREVWKWTEDAADDAWVATRVKAKVAAEMALAEAENRAQRKIQG